jgi:non-ribosomal peptide synthetase component F
VLFRSFWIEQFKNEVPILDLPTSYPRPSKRTFKANSKTLMMDKDTISKLKKFSAGMKTSLTVVLLAGFKILLHRLTGQNEIVVGIPAADQAVTGLHNLVGHCVNTLPLKSSITGDMKSVEFIKSVKNTMLSAYDHQRFTYGSLLKNIKISRDLSHLPLVSILFNIDPGMKALNINGLKETVKTNLRRFENFDMFLNGTELDGAIFLECLYNSDIFDKETMDWRMEEYKTILMSMMESQDSTINEINVLPDSEYTLQIKEWNRTDCEFDKNSCLHDLFLASAGKYPDSTAVVFENQSMTYSVLDRHSDVMALKLKIMGVRPGSLVGIYLERNINMIVALLGILKAGGAYVPIDPEYPRERIDYMIENSGASTIVTQSNLDRSFIKTSVNFVCIDSMNFDSNDAGEMPPGWKDPSGSDLAYVIYTSGSTGKPKGVKVPHRALVNFMASMAKVPGVSAGDILLAVTTLSFDIAGLELFLPLSTGATVHMVSRETATDG